MSKELSKEQQEYVQLQSNYFEQNAKPNLKVNVAAPRFKHKDFVKMNRACTKVFDSKQKIKSVAGQSPNENTQLCHKKSMIAGAETYLNALNMWRKFDSKQGLTMQSHNNFEKNPDICLSTIQPINHPSTLFGGVSSALVSGPID